ncbi:hypothetical protein NFHSH190041_37180 (plasmid) [Shewanella sp. NFH-SH190041]|nr:hypothetical protein NFHSH190041_37180 [Shewanella sp. NFH-SH190041]
MLALFKNLTILQFNPDMFVRELVLDAVLGQPHTPIDDAKPSKSSCGFGSLDMDENIPALFSDDGQLLMLRYIKESRTVDAGQLSKRYKKALDKLECDGRRLDDEQISKLKSEQLQLLLAEVPSDIDSLIMVFDIPAGMVYLNNTGAGVVKDAKALICQMFDLSVVEFLPEVISGAFSRWITTGTVSAGLTLGGTVKGVADKTVLQLSNADLQADLLTEILTYFNIKKLALLGWVKAHDVAWRYASFSLNDSGRIQGLEVDLGAFDFDGGGVADELNVFGQLCRTLTVQLCQSVGLGLPPQWVWSSDVLFRSPVSDNAPQLGQCDDPALYREAVALVQAESRVSVSMIQRYFKIGYNRAAELVEMMEKGGIVSPAGHNGQRSVLRGVLGDAGAA